MKKTSRERIEKLLMTVKVDKHGGHVAMYKEDALLIAQALLDAGLVLKDSIVVDEEKVFYLYSDIVETLRQDNEVITDSMIAYEISEALANTNIFKIKEPS